MGLIHVNAQPTTSNAALFTATAAAPTTLAYGAGSTGLSTFPGSVAYFWKITFLNEYGEETIASNEATGTPAATFSAALTWTAPPAGTTAVKVYRGTVTNTENVLVATLAGTAASYADIGLGSVATTPGSPPATEAEQVPLTKIIAINATTAAVTLTLTVVRALSHAIENVTIPAGAVIPAGCASSLVEDRLLAMEEIVLEPGDALWGLASTGSAVTVVAFE
jgi:hypothetical protein